MLMIFWRHQSQRPETVPRLSPFVRKKFGQIALATVAIGGGAAGVVTDSFRTMFHVVWYGALIWFGLRLLVEVLLISDWLVDPLWGCEDNWRQQHS